MAKTEKSTQNQWPAQIEKSTQIQRLKRRGTRHAGPPPGSPPPPREAAPPLPPGRRRGGRPRGGALRAAAPGAGEEANEVLEYSFLKMYNSGNNYFRYFWLIGLYA